MEKDEDFQFDFERLKVYQCALRFIDKIFEVYRKLPKEFKYFIGSNLLRAGLSIANNLAEGSGKKSKKEKARYYGTSLDSARECVSVFNVLVRQSFLDKTTFKDLRSDSREITNMITGLINSL